MILILPWHSLPSRKYSVGYNWWTMKIAWDRRKQIRAHFFKKKRVATIQLMNSIFSWRGTPALRKCFLPTSKIIGDLLGVSIVPPPPPQKKKQCWQAFAGRLIGITLPLVCYTQPPFRHVPTHHLPRQCCGRQNTTVPNEGVTLKKKTLPKLKNSLLHTERKCFFDSMFASFHPLRNPLKPKITPFIYT